MFRQILRGTGVALVTPFDKNHDIDYECLARVIDFVIEGGVQYLVTLGTTGETPTLSREEKISIIEYTSKIIKERVPLVVGIGGNNTRELVRDLETFPLETAQAVLSASPAYSKPSQEGIYFHFKALAAASPKPLIVYNVPSRTGRNINTDTVIRLANEVENILGIKDASGDMAQCMVLLRDRPDGFAVISGDDALTLPQLACGMDGVISVAANSFPVMVSAMVQYCLSGEFAQAKCLNDQLLEGCELLFAENSPAGVKAALSELGLIENYLRLPLVPLSDRLHSKMLAYLDKQRKTAKATMVR